MVYFMVISPHPWCEPINWKKTNTCIRKDFIETIIIFQGMRHIIESNTIWNGT